MPQPWNRYAAAALLCCTPGCGPSAQPPAPASAQAAAAAVDGRSFLLEEEPQGAVGVISARADGQHQRPIVVVGRVGGQSNPWISGRAAFMLIDPSMSVVGEGRAQGDGEICTGDCCAAQRAKCTTMVKFVDRTGRVLPVDARDLLGIGEADLLVVRGKSQRDKHGNYAVIADGVYLRR